MGQDEGKLAVPQPFVTEEQAEIKAVQAVTDYVNSCNCKNKVQVLAVLQKIVGIAMGIHDGIEHGAVEIKRMH